MSKPEQGCQQEADVVLAPRPRPIVRSPGMQNLYAIEFIPQSHEEEQMLTEAIETVRRQVRVRNDVFLLRRS